MATEQERNADTGESGAMLGEYGDYEYDPELAAALPFCISIPFEDIEVARRVEADWTTDALKADAEELARRPVSTSDVEIRSSTGPHEIKARIYRPTRVTGQVGGLLFLHGGGYSLGSIETEHARCVQFADEAECMVVSVDYRLAPECPFPAGLDDCYDALLWVSRNAESLGVDIDRLSVGGTSAGGGLAAAIAQRARDEGGPALVLQLLVYPALDSRMATVSNSTFIDTPGWNSSSNAAMWKYYVDGAERPSPYAAPALARAFEGLPPTTMVVAELDPLRDEALEYAAALLRANVPVELHLFRGTFHAFDVFAPFARVSHRAVAEQVHALWEALHR